MDVVVTVPMNRWFDWITEGDNAGEPETGEEWGFSVGGAVPQIKPGERVYVAAHGRLRGYAPLTRIRRCERGQGCVLGRKAGAVAVTIAERVPGFQGWRYVWWRRDQELPFPEWKTENVTPQTRYERELLAKMVATALPVGATPG